MSDDGLDFSGGREEITLSVPFKYCLFVQAAEDPDVLARLAPLMRRNLEEGHYTVLPCNHNPPCRNLTEEERLQLDTAFRTGKWFLPEGNSSDREGDLT